MKAPLCLLVILFLVISSFKKEDVELNDSCRLLPIDRGNSNLHNYSYGTNVKIVKMERDFDPSGYGNIDKHVSTFEYDNSRKLIKIYFLISGLKDSFQTYTYTNGILPKAKWEYVDGFIAQEIEKIVPEAVNKIQDYIPSIYDMAQSIVYDSISHTLVVATNKAHDFREKDEIKLISLHKEHKVKVDSIIDAHTFVVANWEKPVDKLFVFGKRVDDFRTVDYDRLFTLGISSIQELSRKVELLERENSLLKVDKDEFSQIKNQVAELKMMLLNKDLNEKVTVK